MTEENTWLIQLKKLNWFGKDLKMAHKKYRCADYAAFNTLKEARKHAAELSKSVDRENRHITSLIYVCVDCKAFYGVYLPYEAKKREPVIRSAEIIPFPKCRITRTNPGLIELRRAA